MALVFLLKQKDLELAAAEAKAASYGWEWWRHKESPADGVLLLESRTAKQHLALTRRIIRLLAQCARGNVRATLDAIPWAKHLKAKRYKVQLTKQTPGPETERELATIIWHQLQEPHVDLEHPDITIDIVLAGTTCYIGTRVWENEDDFESRRAHLRPEMHPSSMHPGLARALVNVSCARSVHDPFCGSGGIVIEAGLAHKRSSGADIDTAMIQRAKKNCASFGLHPDLRVADATQWMPRSQAVVTDLPYGRNTSPVALRPLLEAFLIRASQSTSRAVIGLPHAMPMPEGWAVRAHFTSYVHKSMTKHFYVLEKEVK